MASARRRHLRRLRPAHSGRAGTILVFGLAILLLVAAGAFAFQALGPAGRVNDDLAAGINKTINVSGEDPTNADVTGGTLVAGNKAVPWAIFRQQEAGGAQDQIFSRSFAGGVWTTRGNGTVGGRSSASPVFTGSLNFDQNQNGETPAIDFAGGGRAVPWATWYEDTTGAGFNANNIFASRFDGLAGDPNQNKWIFAGQDRGLGGGTVPVPSLNIHPAHAAENPSVAGGSTVDPTKPGPWITWQEVTTKPVSGRNQIFAVRPIGPGAANCDGVTPAGVLVGGHVPAIGGFCWQQVGVGRVGANSLDPSLNVDPTRNGIEPDIAFTGTNDSVPWVVWYETNVSGISGLHSNEMVFAAKAVSSPTGADSFQWVAVGNAFSATLDRSGVNGFGACADSAVNEEGCSLNQDPAADAEDPRIASGTMVRGNPTVPWVAWDETVAGMKRIFVSRLVVSGGTAKFQIVNGGAPISKATGNATRPDITFSDGTPYVTWRANVAGVDKGFAGHFVNPANPKFVLDVSAIPLTPTAQADVREPISSACTANPFNTDGFACQGAALGTPFFLYTKGTAPRGLFAGAYQPSAVKTGAATNVTTSSATVAGSVNPLGAPVQVFFQFGTTTAYGSSTPPQITGADNAADAFSATLSGLPGATTIHYRAVAASDFGTFVGPDETFTTS